MNKTELISAIDKALGEVSNTGALTQDQAQAKMSLDIGTAIDSFVATNSPDKTDSIKNVLNAIVQELQKQKITIGTNLSADRLIDILETINDI